MKRIIVFLFLIPTILSGQRIFITGEKCKADFDIIYTRHFWQADICVRTVAYEYQAGRSRTRDGCDNWFYVNNIWEADYAVRVVNSIHPGRKTLYVYRDNNDRYTPPLRDRNDPRNRYDHGYDDHEYDDRGYDYRYDDYRPKVNIDIRLFKRF